jgi:FKBP-type peptidyl-prolyl cis-trans isomerase FkpA
MRILILCLVGALLFLGSCAKKNGGCSIKSDSTAAPLVEQDSLKSFIDSAGIAASLDPRGFYYAIINPGMGSRPGPCSQITVSYKGTLVNGSVFDQQQNFVTTMNRLIDGWQEGITLIETGGEIMLYLPPTLGYGSSGNNDIPPNSILIFDITLLHVQ